MKKILLILCGILYGVSVHATVVKLTVDMSEKKCTVERFTSTGILYSRHVTSFEVMSRLIANAQTKSELQLRQTGSMNVVAVGDTFNVIHDNSPVPYPSWRFMRYFSVNTGTYPMAFASIKICEAIDSSSCNWLYYTVGVPIYATDDSLLTDFGIWNPCTPYSYGVDMYVAGDTTKSPLEVVQISSCTGIAEAAFEKVSVFPNPAMDMLYAPLLVGHNARIVSSEGRVVWNGKVSEQGIDVRSFSSGVYLLSTEDRLTVRFVKKE